MDYVNLGRTGLKVSRICLGTMTYGSSKWRPWVLDEGESRPFIKRALEAGINFFDTADMYSLGASEEVLGQRAQGLWPGPRPRGHRHEGLQRDGRRSEPARPLAQAHQARDRRQPQAARDRLRGPVPDPPVRPRDADRGDDGGAPRPRERGQGALHRRVVDVRLAVREDAPRRRTRAAGRAFVTMQNHYNLLYREEEREMVPFCADEAVGAPAVEPARARHSRPRPGSRDDAGRDGRLRAQPLRAGPLRGGPGDHRGGAEGGGERGVPPAQVALAWLCQRPSVVAPIVGASKPHHIEDAVAALALRLSADEVAALEAPYLPRAVAGHQ